jgi:hypothetical protein
MERLPGWLKDLLRLHEASATEREARIWQPGDGDILFRGRPGNDLLWLDGATLAELREGLRLDDPALRMRVAGNGTVGFVDAEDRPALASGCVTIGGETLWFTGLARFAFLW